MNALRLTWTELSRFTSGPVLRHLVPVALMLIPTLYGVLYLWSNWDPFGHMANVPVAVVNLDRPMTVKLAGSADQRVSAGEDFVSELRKDRSLRWSFVDAATAAEGVRDGRFMFSVTVPADFSQRLTSPLTRDPRQAQLLIQTNDANGYIASTKIAETAEKELQAKIDAAAFKAYTSGVLNKLMDMHAQLATAADGAKQVADGSGQAASGSATLAAGTLQLSAGADQLADGTGQLVSGTGQLVDGSAQLAAGTSQLADGTGRLSTGADQVAGGAAQVAAGTRQMVSVLNDALSVADVEIGRLGRLITSEAQAMHSLTAAAAVVAGRVAADSGNIHAEMVKVCADLPVKTPRTEAICAELDQVSARAERDSAAMADALRKLDGDLQRAGSIATRDLVELVDLLTRGSGALVPVTRATTLVTDATYADTSRILELLRQLPAPDAEKRVAEINELAKQTNVAQHHLEDGLLHLVDLLRKVSAEIPGLVARIDEGVAQVRLLDSGANQVASGAEQLAQGTTQLVDGTTQLVIGADQLAGGATQLADGAGRLNDGAGQLRDGLRQAAPATQQLASGLSALNKGSKQLADGLAAGVAQIPTLDDQTQQRTADVLSEPVALVTDNLNPAQLYGRGLAPFFFSIALWVFGLIAFQMLRAANPRALSGHVGAPAIATGAWAAAATLGAGGALVLYAVTQLGLGLNAVHPWSTVGLMVLGVASFAAIAHLLRLAFGVVGELLTLVLLMLQLTSSGGLYPLQTAPPLFRALHPLLPMTYLVDGLRVTISGGLGSHLWRDVLVLAGFLVAALALSSLVVIRQRRWTMSRLYPAI